MMEKEELAEMLTRMKIQAGIKESEELFNYLRIDNPRQVSKI